MWGKAIVDAAKVRSLIWFSGSPSLVVSLLAKLSASISLQDCKNAPSNPNPPSPGSTASRFDVMLYWSGCAAQHSGRLVFPSAHLVPFFPVSPPPVVLAATAVLARLSFFRLDFDTIGLDSMNELASAPCAHCVESSLIKEKFSSMSSPDPHAYDFSHLVVFCSRSNVSFTSFPFHSVRAVVPRFDISLFALFCFVLLPV